MATKWVPATCWQRFQGEHANQGHHRRSAPRGRIFEARKPRETAIISEIDGVVRFGEVAKGQRKIYVTADNGDEKEYSVPRGIHVNVQEGERLSAGDPLMDGRSTLTTFLPCWAKKRCRLTWSTKSRKSTACRA